MKINKQLNLIIPIYGEPTILKEKDKDGKDVEIEVENITSYVHATPLHEASFRKYYLLIAKTFAKMNAEDLSATTGPRVAAMLLEDVARAMPGKDGAANGWEGPEGAARGLVAEIVRLANLLIQEDGKWTMIPLQEALNRKLITEEDQNEVINSLTFFIVGSAMYPKTDKAAVLTFASKIWGGRIESLSCMELMNSLQTSTVTVSSGVKTPEDLSIPS